MGDAGVWSAVDRRRRAVVELLTGLGPHEWNIASLCEGWRVRDVAAHLTMPLLSIRQLAGLALRHPGGTNRLIKEGSSVIYGVAGAGTAPRSRNPDLAPAGRKREGSV